MINNDLFITVVVMVLLSIVSVIAIVVLSAFSGIELYRTKKLKYAYAKIGVIVAALFILYLGLPFWLLSAAYKTEDLSHAGKYYDLALKTSLFPSVKAVMYSEKGSYYNSAFRGEDAIAEFEKAYSINKDEMVLAQLCLLYTIKGDKENAIAACVQTKSNQLAAINGILNKDYTIALNLIDMEIQNDEKPSCHDYAVRGYIYRALGQNELFLSDYNTAVKMCPKNEKLKELYNNKNYYEEHYANLKKKYKF